MTLSPARRVATVEEITKPGDYCGPIMGYSGDRPAILFLLPIARDPDVPRGARSQHHVCAPPHIFRECEDGSVEIRESIGCGWNPEDPHDYYWHGYLDEGNVWRQC